MRFVGAPWVRRAETPDRRALRLDRRSRTARSSRRSSRPRTSSSGTPRRRASATRSTTATRARESLGSQINEKSLRLIGRGLGSASGRRRTCASRPAPQNLLNYRELRVWARGRGAGWEEGDLQAFVKLGSDDRNFYLYRAPASTTTWEPEFVVDLEAWRRLRAPARGRAGSAATTLGRRRVRRRSHRLRGLRGPLPRAPGATPGSTRRTSRRCRRSPPACTGSRRWSR